MSVGFAAVEKVFPTSMASFMILDVWRIIGWESIIADQQLRSSKLQVSLHCIGSTLPRCAVHQLQFFGEAEFNLANCLCFFTLETRRVRSASWEGDNKSILQLHCPTYTIQYWFSVHLPDKKCKEKYKRHALWTAYSTYCNSVPIWDLSN